MTAIDEGYVFDNHNLHATEQHRCLAAAYDPATLAHLERTGVGPGWRCLEVGAGGGSVAHWLAGRGASVLATDVKPEHVPPAAGLTVLRHDVVHDPLPEAGFDLVHARLVLLHLPEREQVLRKLVRALKPGGVLQLDEFDLDYGPVLLAAHPEHAAAYEDFLAAKERMFDAAGADRRWGRRVAASMAAAGLVDVDPVPVVRQWHADSPGLRLLVHHTHHLRDKLLAAGLTDTALRTARAAMAHPAFRATSCVFYTVQGKRPGRR
ncbi:class I SAM-dependent methyltransferase [Actinosynnema sp. NPDC002837]